MRRTRLLITGATGKLGRPVATALAAGADVWAVGRFGDAAVEEELTAAGVTCVRGDLAGDLTTLPPEPDAFDTILNLAVTKTGDWGTDLDANLGGPITLLHRYPRAAAFVHVSSCEVYDPDAERPYREDSPRGDARAGTSVHSMRTYSVNKIAAECAVMSTARALGVPSLIARLSAPYGDDWGWPAVHLTKVLGGEPIVVHPDGPNVFSLLHVDDIIEMIPRLVAAASVPSRVINLGGDEPVSIEEWVCELGRLVGVEPVFETSTGVLRSIPVDVESMRRTVGTPTVDWRSGMRRLAATLGGR